MRLLPSPRLGDRLPLRGRRSSLKAVLQLAVLQLLLCVATCLAHDTGFGHSRRTLYVTATKGGYTLEYRVTQGADEALVEMTRIDADRDGQISPNERDAWFAQRGGEIARNLRLRTATGAVEPRFDGCTLEPSFVQIFRFTIDSKSSELWIDDRNFGHKPGVVRIKTGAGLKAELTEPVDLSHAERVPLRLFRVP